MAFFGLLKKKKAFNKEPIIEKSTTNMIDTNDISRQDPIAQMIASIPDDSQKAEMKTYDILVFEPNTDGTKKQRQVSGVKAHSPRDLVALYAADGCQIQILKEYDASVSSVPLQASQQTQFKKQESPNSVEISKESVKSERKPQFHESARTSKEPPKFFEIGGVKCKLENGKMYQEQWVRVDSSKYRLIADSTNKLVSMNGKHLETLKWVQIEDTNENEGDIENA